MNPRTSTAPDATSTSARPKPAHLLTSISVLALLVAPMAARCQDVESERRWWNLWTETSEENRVIWGMWTLHIHHLDEGWSNDKAGAVFYRGFYGATFRTTHGPRAYSLGVERSWLGGEWGPTGGMVGFRTGLVYGYDNRLGWLAERYPVLPFAQGFVYGRAGPVALDVAYTWVVVSLSASLAF